jgi:hypothetical protein
MHGRRARTAIGSVTNLPLECQLSRQPFRVPRRARLDEEPVCLCERGAPFSFWKAIASSKVRTAAPHLPRRA